MQEVPRTQGPPVIQMGELERYASFATELATTAGDLLTSRFGQSLHSHSKGDGTLVTDADRAADRLIHDQIAAHYPSHAVLSEERNTVYAPGSTFTWIIDPLDGTTNFANGLATWGVSVALVVDGYPVVGALVFPLLREVFTATATRGALCNGKTIHVSPTRSIGDNDFLLLCTRTQRRYAVEVPGKPRILGSSAYHIAALARGAAVAALDATPKLWDIAAALLILQEAGGCYRGIESTVPLFPLPHQPLDYANRPYPLLAAATLAVQDQIAASIRCVKG